MASRAAAATRHAYLGGVAYAVQRLSERVPGAALYLDAGDGATLGWGERVRTFVTLVAHLGELAPSVAALTEVRDGEREYGSHDEPEVSMVRKAVEAVF